MVCDGSTGEIIHVDAVKEAATELLAWIAIESSGKITIFTHRLEMGQGNFQAIPQIIAQELEVNFIAQELEVNLDQVSIRFAAANPQKYGPQPRKEASPYVAGISNYCTPELLPGKCLLK